MSDYSVLPLSSPVIKGNEWNYIKECLDSGWVSSGKFVGEFEKGILGYTGSNYAVACINGTAALQVSLQVAGVKSQDEVIVPTVTFIAPVNAVRYLGAEPVFMDCDDFYNIDLEKVTSFIKEETVIKGGVTVDKMTGKVIRALLPVHVFGNAVDLREVIFLCKERNISVIEDATESLGTFYRDGPYKNKYTGTIGDLGCYSFNGNKIITTGGGGMVITDNPEYAKKIRYLINQAKNDALRYIHDEVGYNFRLTNLQAAMGLAQLEQLSLFIAAKKKNYALYKEKIAKIDGLELAEVPGYAENNCWMYALRIDKKKYPKDREGLTNYLWKNGIETRPLWHLAHLQKPYRNNRHYRIERAYRLLEMTLNIPCSANLTKTDIEHIANLLMQ